MSDPQHTIAKDIIPEPVLRRLPWYLAYINMLNNQQVENVSSTRIADELNVDSSQIAKDLSYLNIKGKTRIGYDVRELQNALEQFLCFKQKHNAVIIGVGSLGGALMRDSGLESYGLNIVAGFDTNPALIGQSIGNITIYHPDSLKQIHDSLDVKVGIITVPYESAQSVADACMEAGVSAIWNFTPFRIRVRDNVVIQNTSIYSNLAVMYNRLGNLR